MSYSREFLESIPLEKTTRYIRPIIDSKPQHQYGRAIKGSYAFMGEDGALYKESFWCPATYFPAEVLEAIESRGKKAWLRYKFLYNHLQHQRAVDWMFYNRANQPPEQQTQWGKLKFWLACKLMGKR